MFPQLLPLQHTISCKIVKTYCFIFFLTDSLVCIEYLTFLDKIFILNTNTLFNLMTFRILITGAIHSSGIEALKQEPDLDIDFLPDLVYEKIIEIINQYHCIITRSETSISKELIDQASKLKVIARAAVGVDNIDIQYATQKGILVLNTPAQNTNSAAELTFALLLATARKLIPAHHSTANGQWSRHLFIGSELQHKTLGIIGLGTVGSRVAKFAQGFEMKVIAYDPYISNEAFVNRNVESVSLKQLLQQSDFISIHATKTNETIGMIDAKSFDQMKQSAILINAARGGIVVESDLYDALVTGKIIAAGIDTWEEEPLRKNPLQALEQVVMSPHIGASTKEAQMKIASSISKQVPLALRGEIVDHPVNMPLIQSVSSQVSQYTSLAEKLGRIAFQLLNLKPQKLLIQRSGILAQEDDMLLQLAFLKGFFQKTHEINYVNAQQIAQNAGLHISSHIVPKHESYQTVLSFKLNDDSHSFTIGGGILGGVDQRITLLNDFRFEMEAFGNIIVLVNQDIPGIIGKIGTILGDQTINIARFDLSRNTKGGKAMALIGVDEPITAQVIETLQQQTGILSINSVNL